MSSNNKTSPLDSSTNDAKVYTVPLDTKHSTNDIVSSTANKEDVLSPKNPKVTQEALNFTIKITKSFKICIYKPLIPLKLAQFCWFGGGSFMGAFLTVFLKQRGVSLSQLSWMTVVAPIVQLTGTTVTGVIADKMGRSKPVLVANILLVMTMIIGILLMPSLNIIHCEPQKINFMCFDLDNNNPPISAANCDFLGDVIKLSNCDDQCVRNITSVFNETDWIATRKSSTVEMSIFPSFIYVNQTFKVNNSCYYDISSLTSPIIPNTWCENPESRNCQMNCTGKSTTTYCTKTDSLSIIFICYAVLYVLFLTTYSNVYRCMDVTSIALTKEHNGNFGRERFFAICGNLMISPLAGVIVDVTTVGGGDKNYAASLYLFIGMSCLVLIILCKLPVQINPPGQKMWKKSFHLLKNPDFVSLAIVILVLGTAWNFTKIFVFWYLDDLHSPSVLMGLIPSISALYGLPFLLTASWWVEKIGCTHLFIFAFLGYAADCVGYSYLINPWFSLLLESFGGITYYLLWVAVIIYSHELAPEGLRATVVAVAGAIHYSVGKSAGGLVGGLVMNSFGGKVAFRLIATVCMASAILYGIYLIIRKRFFSMELKLDKLNKELDAEKETNCIYVLQNKS